MSTLPESSSEESDDTTILGTITLSYGLTPDGTIVVDGTLPSLDDVPLVVQFGMLEFARDLLWRVSNQETGQ